MNERSNKQLTPRQRHRRMAFGMCGVAALLAVSIVVMAQDPKPRETRAHASVAPIFNDTPAIPVVGDERVDVERAVIEEKDETPAAKKGGERPGEKTLLVVEGLEDGKLTMLMHKSAVLTTRGAYKRVSIGAPEIADVNPIGPANILVTAKKAGTTQMIVWDDYDRSQVLDVVVQVDLNALKDQLKEMFPGSKVEVSMANNQVILKGQVPSLQVAEQAVQLAAPYAAKVLNFLEISGGQQVMLQVRFAEVSRSATNALGVNFGFTDGTSFFGNNIGSVSPLGLAAGNILSPGAPSASVSLFGKGAVGSTTFNYYLTALRQNNLLRILAEPNLVAISGQEASFLAGGEFPIPVTQGGSTAGAVTIEYRQFGVKLFFTPVVLGDGKIRLKVAPEVSDLDFTTAVRFQGFVIPGLTQRRLQTTVELHEGQTFALAGLLNNNVSATKDVVPLLGDLPVMGALFRSVRYQRKETELVVIVTPRLVEALNPAQVPMLPGEKWRHPNEGELFWQRDLGGPTGDAKRAANPKNATATGETPRFKGQFGFVPAESPETPQTVTDAKD